MELAIRQINIQEMEMVYRLANLVYPVDFHEDMESFESKFNLFPKGFLGIFSSNELDGYIISHPWKGEREVPLNYILKKVISPDRFYLHDVVVHPEYRGRGYGKALLENAMKVGIEEGFKLISAVAVSSSGKGILESFGFRESKEIEYALGLKAYKMNRNFM